VCVEVRCGPGEAREGLIQRYAAFESVGGPVDLVVDVQAHPTFRNHAPAIREYPGMDARWDGDRYRFDRTDLAVALDARGSPARVEGTVRDVPAGLDSVLRASLSVLLPRRSTLLLHASGVVADGRAFLFVGKSGAGKSTAAALTGERRLLSDDIVAVSVDGGLAVANSVPFTGLQARRTAPLQAPVELICLLEQAREDVLEPARGGPATGDLLRCVLHLPLADPATGEVLDLVGRLVEAVPLRRLRFRRDPSVWPALRRLGGRRLDGPARLDRGGSARYHGGNTR
jgi:hypothetical protein